MNQAAAYEGGSGRPRGTSRGRRARCGSISRWDGEVGRRRSTTDENGPESPEDLLRVEESRRRPLPAPTSISTSTPNRENEHKSAEPAAGRGLFAQSECVILTQNRRPHELRYAPTSI